MTVRGSIKADELRIAQLTLDLTTSPVRMEVMAALVDSDTGDTRAWVPCRGNMWSAETQEALRELLNSMERDIARSVMRGGGDGGAVQKKGLSMPSPGGISEHIGDAEAESM